MSIIHLPNKNHYFSETIGEGFSYFLVILFTKVAKKYNFCESTKDSIRNYHKDQEKPRCTLKIDLMKA